MQIVETTVYVGYSAEEQAKRDHQRGQVEALNEALEELSWLAAHWAAKQAERRRTLETIRAARNTVKAPVVISESAEPFLLTTARRIVRAVKAPARKRTIKAYMSATPRAALVATIFG